MTKPGCLDTFHDLYTASSVEELWSVLLSCHGIRSSTQWEEPYVLFRRFHVEGPDNRGRRGPVRPGRIRQRERRAGVDRS